MKNSNSESVGLGHVESSSVFWTTPPPSKEGEALSWVKNIGYQKVVYELDAKMVVYTVHSTSFFPSFGILGLFLFGFLLTSEFLLCIGENHVFDENYML